MCIDPSPLPCSPTTQINVIRTVKETESVIHTVLGRLNILLSHYHWHYSCSVGGEAEENFMLGILLSGTV